MKRLSVLTVLFVILFNMVCYAGDDETTSDLIALYDNAVYVPSQEEMNEFTRQLNEYNKLVAEDKRINEYNQAVEDAEQQQNNMIRTAQEQVNSLLHEAGNCSYQISSNIYGDINELKRYDSEYKTYVAQADVLLQQISKFSTTGKLATIDVDLDKRRQELEEMQESMEIPKVQKVSGEFILGEVYYAQSPAGVPYTLLSQWGARLDPITKTSIQYHNGIDIQAAVGTNVMSVFNGRVLEAGDNWALGKYVRIQHGSGVVSVYAHLSEISCISGQNVSQYEIIGKSGSSGNLANGECLHFGLFINGQSVDPNVLLKNAK